jgi:hypothetical protein
LEVVSLSRNFEQELSLKKLFGLKKQSWLLIGLQE